MLALGVHEHLHAGRWPRTSSTCSAAEPAVDRAVALPQDQVAARSCSSVTAAGLVRVPDARTPSSGKPIRARGVAAEVLVGEERAPSRPGRTPTPGPSWRWTRCRPPRRAAAEGLDVGRGVHVRDRHGASATPASASTSQASSTWSSRPCRPSSSPPRGRAGSPADVGRSGCRRDSAMKWTPQNTMYSASGRAAAPWRA